MSHASRGKWLFAAVLLTLVAAASQTMAADDITGEWTVAAETDFGPMQGTVTFEKKPDGTLAGKWGAVALSNVKLENDQLTFTRTMPMPGAEMTQNFKGIVKEGKLTGVMSGDQGESKVTGTKKKPLSPAVGVWDLKYAAGSQNVTARMTISQKPDGALEAKWDSQMGQSVVSNVKFADGKLTLDRAAKINDQEMKMTFAGTVQGDKLTGTIKNDMGETPVAGIRFGTEIIGKWELTSVSDMGTFTSLMVINPDLTGTYEIFSDVAVKDLKFEDGQLTFAAEMGFGDQTFRMTFSGKVEGKILKGQMTSDMGASQVTGKKLEPAAPAAGSPPAQRKTR